MFKLIDDTLKELDPEIHYSRDASYLVWGTGAHESMGFTKRRQMGGGPAMGLFQMEPATFWDNVNNYLVYRPRIADKIKQICGIDDFHVKDLLTNDKLAICMCRIKYLRAPDSLPDTLSGMAAYWKTHYNTREGKGTEEEFTENYIRYSINEREARF